MRSQSDWDNLPSAMNKAIWIGENPKSLRWTGVKKKTGTENQLHGLYQYKYARLCLLNGFLLDETYDSCITVTEDHDMTVYVQGYWNIRCPEELKHGHLLRPMGLGRLVVLDKSLSEVRSSEWYFQHKGRA